MCATRPEQPFLRHLGYYFGLADVDTRFGQPNRVVMRNAPNRTLCVDRYGDRSAALFLFHSEEPLDRTTPNRIFAERFTDEFWPTGVVEALRANEDIYFDSLSQVRMASWSTGRVALAGDAAYAPSLVTGQGTNLAMTGAYLLAGELHAVAGEHDRAFAAYERRFRPQVTRAQRGTRQGIGMLVPATERAIRWRNRLTRLAFLQRALPHRQPAPLPDYQVSAATSPPPARPRPGARASGRSGRTDG